MVLHKEAQQGKYVEPFEYIFHLPPGSSSCNSLNQNPPSKTDMHSPLRTLVKRLQAHTTKRPRTSLQRAFNINALKQRTAHWEPAIDLNDLNQEDLDSNGNDTELVHMSTFSAFNPGASHPLLLNCALPSSLRSRRARESRGSTFPASAHVQTSLVTSRSNHAVRVQQSGTAPGTSRLRPRPCGDGFGGGVVGTVKRSVL